jgi:uncharacterized protein
MMIDVHAHFLTEQSGRSDWRDVNRKRLEAGDAAGITMHVASILGTWGHRSPTYFPSSQDVEHANDRMLELAVAEPSRVRAYCVVNPNYPEHALDEIDRGVERGAVGVKLAASRRATDPLLDAIADRAGTLGLPVLHHVWQRRRRDWPGQEASDGEELASLARRHPGTNFLLAHISGGGDWSHSLRAVAGVPNVFVDLSGSGVDSGMLERVLEEVGVSRMVWGCDLTIDTGLAKMRYLETLGLRDDHLMRIRAGNAVDIFPDGAFA